ncbi:MAG TPA: FAD-dependent oxidoreductase, partial [Opitutaceae bacterium]|nr:FAD-dependent oxidoreductase [Opitutaceae bacterium]
MNVVIVGGGIVGLATALAVKERQPGARVILLEKEPDCGRHQSTHNSGVLHAGLYYRPGSLKAKFAVEGIRRMTRFCEQHAIAHQICGKLVVATTPHEVVRLKALLERGTANGLRGLEWLASDALKEIEPHATGLAAVRVPEEGIVDYAAVCAAMARELSNLGGTVRTHTRVTRILRDGNAWMVLSTAGEFR